MCVEAVDGATLPFTAAYKLTEIFVMINKQLPETTSSIANITVQ
jgi:hypothetical protein